MRKAKTRRTANIHPEAHELLKELSLRSGRKMNFLIDEALFNYLTDNKRAIKEAEKRR
jgi:hypothetical protein